MKMSVSFIKRLGLCLCLFLLLLPICAYGEDSQSSANAIQYATAIEVPDIEGLVCGVLDGKVTVYQYKGSASQLTIPEQINGYPVTAIDEMAFAGCTSLTSISIPSSVTFIGKDNFSHCSSLTAIETAKDSYTYQWCSENGYEHLLPFSLTITAQPTNVTVEKDVIATTSIIAKGDGVTYQWYYANINDESFIESDYTTDTYSVKMTDSNDGQQVYCVITDQYGQQMKSDVVMLSIAIPDGLKYSSKDGSVYITGYVGNASKLDIPSKIAGKPVVSIEKRAFEDCDSLVDVTIPDSVTSIGERAFRYCSGLTSITIPDSVTSIGEGTFESCINLTRITLPNSINSIENQVFYHCVNLKRITIPESVLYIRDFAFIECTSLTGVTLPKNLYSIGKSAFAYCSSLKKIVIPGSCTRINEYAFAYCDNITEVNIMDGVQYIGNYAFYKCKNLLRITIPESVRTMGTEALLSNHQGRSIYVKKGSYADKWCKYYGTAIRSSDVYYK